MRRMMIGLLACTVAGVAFAHVGTSALLGSFAKAINGATTVKSDFTIQTIGSGAPEGYTVTLKKPNMARIETPQQVIVADGKTITTYDKNQKTYFKKPETDGDLNGLFQVDELHLWAGFFNTKAYDAVQSKDLGDRTVKGASLQAVEASYDSQQRKVITYLLSHDDNMARKAQIELDKKDPSKAVSMILDTKSLDVNGKISDDAFTFVPPADSREMTLEEMNSAKWYTNLDEAKRVAAASGKKIFVDFFATWCGPCKMLARDCFETDTFKKLSSKLVFCRIDVDDQASIAQQYSITAMPTQMVLDKDGAVLQTRVGYSNANDFFSFLNGAVGS